MASTTKVLIAGCGDLGIEVARRLMQSTIGVVGLRRHIPPEFSGISSHHLEMIAADVTQPASLHMLKTMQPEIILYCVAAGGQSDDEYRAAYVDGLRNVLAAQQKNTQLRHVFFVSSTRVYGQETETVLDESVPALPADFGGQRLLEGEHLLRGLTCDYTVLRLSGIYGPGRLRMINLAKSADHWPKQNIWTNRIHRDDAAAFIVFLIKQVLAGHRFNNCYIVTDCKPAPQYEVLNWLATQMRTTQADLMPVSGGKRLTNHSMLETGFKLQYPDYRAGYLTLLPP